MVWDWVTQECRPTLHPLKVSAETLVSEIELEKPQQKDLLVVINQESDRLNRLVGEAAEVAQLDSHQLQPHIETHQIREAIDAAVQASPPGLRDHPLETAISHKLPAVRMDLHRITE